MPSSKVAVAPTSLAEPAGGSTGRASEHRASNAHGSASRARQGSDRGSQRGPSCFLQEIDELAAKRVWADSRDKSEDDMLTEEPESFGANADPRALIAGGIRAVRVMAFGHVIAIASVVVASPLLLMSQLQEPGAPSSAELAASCAGRSGNAFSPQGLELRETFTTFSVLSVVTATVAAWITTCSTTRGARLRAFLGAYIVICALRLAQKGVSLYARDEEPSRWVNLALTVPLQYAAALAMALGHRDALRDRVTPVNSVNAAPEEDGNIGAASERGARCWPADSRAGTHARSAVVMVMQIVPAVFSILLTSVMDMPDISIAAIALAATVLSKLVAWFFHTLFLHTALPLDLSLITAFYSGNLILTRARSAIATSESTVEAAQGALILTFGEVLGSLWYLLYVRREFYQLTRRANKLRREIRALETAAVVPSACEAGDAGATVGRSSDRANVNTIQNQHNAAGPASPRSVRDRIFSPRAAPRSSSELRSALYEVLRRRRRTLPVSGTHLAADAFNEHAALTGTQLCVFLGNPAVLSNIGAGGALRSDVRIFNWAVQVVFEMLSDFFAGALLVFVAGGFIDAQMTRAQKMRFILFAVIMAANSLANSFRPISACNTCGALDECGS